MGEREIIYLSLHFHHQNDFCIKVGSNESHFHVSLIVRDKVTRQCPQIRTFEDFPVRQERRGGGKGGEGWTGAPNRLFMKVVGSELVWPSGTALGW